MEFFFPAIYQSSLELIVAVVNERRFVYVELDQTK